MRFLLAFALFEPVAVAVHLQDVDVVSEPVQQRAGQPFRAENFGPLLKRQIGLLYSAKLGRVMDRQ